MGSFFALAIGGGVGYWMVLVGQWCGRDLTAPATVIGVAVGLVVLLNLPAPVLD